MKTVHLHVQCETIPTIGQYCAEKKQHANSKNAHDPWHTTCTIYKLSS